MIQVSEDIDIVGLDKVPPPLQQQQQPLWLLNPHLPVRLLLCHHEIPKIIGYNYAAILSLTFKSADG